MSAEITQERIAELRKQYPMCWSRHRSHYPFGHIAYSTLDINDLLDALESSRAEVQRLQRERDAALDERNAWRSGDQNSRIEADRLRGEVQRLTEEARRSDAGRVEVPELTDEDEVWQGLPFRPEYQPMCGAYFAHGYNHARSKARRSDAGRVVVPEITKQDLPYKGNGAPGYEPAFVDYGFARGWQALAARLGHAPSVEKERKQKQRDHYEEWDRENRLNGVEL